MEMAAKTKKVKFKVELRRFTDNGYPEYYIMEPNSCDCGRLVKMLDAEIEVSLAIAKRIEDSRMLED